MIPLNEGGNSTLYAEVVDYVDIEGQKVIAPRTCIRKLKRGECRLYASKSILREPEELKDHVLVTTNLFNRLYKSKYRRTIKRIFDRLASYVRASESNEIIDRAVALATVMHDIGKAVPAYQFKAAPMYRHEYLSATTVYGLLKEVLGLNYVLAAQVALAVLLHHQPRTYRLLEDYNQFLISASIIKKVLSNLEDEDLALIPGAVTFTVDCLRETELFTSDELVRIRNHLFNLKISKEFVERELIRIQSIHVGYPNDDIRRAMRFLIASINHVIMVCDNIAAFKNRASYPECVRACVPYVSLILSFIGVQP